MLIIIEAVLSGVLYLSLGLASFSSFFTNSMMKLLK